ncbi:ArgE/DapE family deacylase [Microterricola viridarii]|uniref:Acetylornithine deacetylase n=1 Tax=Microterricola viridarii TaxID=412690 RepID=A0A1H1QRD1_9MICO|nr:ArgE/DapE family deacylase [Microterricola viridarii]SDS25459.1 acetylornithine deacetylase [Microterricola viridarii]
MTTSAERDAILAAVDAAFDEQLDFTAALIAIPSLRGEENDGQDFMEQAFREVGLDIDRWTLDPAELATHPGAGAVAVSYENTDVVVGTLEPAAAVGAAVGRSLILNGHVDVVPLGSPRLWSRSPWEPAIEDGWMYGRGSGDMKAGLAANVFALRALQRAGLTPRGRIHLQSVPEEESTGNGTLSALQHGYTADAVLITEPSSNAVVRAHTGVIWFRVVVTGRAAHASEMSVGANAIDGAYAVIAELRRMEADWNTRVPESAHFAEQPHPLNLNIGTIRAGDWPSSVPDACELGIRVALLPEMDVEECWEEIVERVQRAVQVDPALAGATALTEKLGFFSDGYVLEPGSDAEAVLAAAHEQATGSALGEVAMPGYIDSRCYGLFAGVPALVYGPLGERLHGADERVNIESVRHVTKAVALFIAEWCGVEAAPATGQSDNLD